MAKPRKVEQMSTAAVKIPPLMTVADFLDWPGDGTPTRYELVDGELRAQDPASGTHATIQSRLGYLLTRHLDAKRPECRVLTTPGVTPRVRAHWNYREPDLGVTCVPNRADEHMIPDPLLLVEILSPSNAKDTYENVRAYATLPTVQQILIVQSTRVGAELLTRGADGAWPANADMIEIGGKLGLTSIGLELALADVYAGTHLA